MDMDFVSDQLIPYEKCVADELGHDMVNQLKNHYATSEKSLNAAIDHIFKNFKTSKLIIQSNKIKDKARNPSKSRNLELKKKLNELKLVLINEEAEINSLAQNTKNLQKRTNKSKNELLNKQSSYSMQESTVKKALEISHNLNESTRRIFFLDSLNQKDSSDFDKFTGDNLSLENLLNIAKSQSTDDYFEVNNVTNSFNSELELILYRIDSSNQLSGTSLAQKNVNTFDKVNELYMELINRHCQKICFIREFENHSKQKNSIKTKISDFLRKNYPRDLMLYGHYLKGYLKYKSLESNLNELKSCLVTFEDQMNQLNNTPDLLAEKQNELNALEKNIHVKQLKLNKLFKDINEKLVNQLPTNVHRMKSNTECLLDLVFSFNSNCFNTINNNFNNNRSRLDITLCSNNNPILYTLNQQSLSQTQIEVYNYKDKNIVDSLLFQENLFSFNELKSQRVLFNKFISFYLEIKNKFVELDKSSRNSIKFMSAKQLTNDLKASLEKCKSFEKNELFGFVEKLKLKLDELNKFDHEITQLEKLVEIWDKQPGAYECNLDIEVKGKRLDYYVERIDQALADYEKKNLMYKY